MSVGPDFTQNNVRLHVIEIVSVKSDDYSGRYTIHALLGRLVAVTLFTAIPA